MVGRGRGSGERRELSRVPRWPGASRPPKHAGRRRTFADIVPCACDQGFFEITIVFNEVVRETEDGGHSRKRGPFAATPVTVTAFHEHVDEDRKAH